MITKGELQNREQKSAEPLRASITPDPYERLAKLEEGIKEARTLKPSGKDLHCADCYQRGRDAVLRLLEG